LFILTAGLTSWLMEKSKNGLKIALIALLIFFACRSLSFIIAGKQQKIIVYNVPRKSAIDFIQGRNYVFTGDTDLLTNDFARNFHLKPSRVLHRIKIQDELRNLSRHEPYFHFNGKNILFLDKSFSFQRPDRPVIDLLVISKNPKINMARLAGSLIIKQVVFDSSVPAWKTRYLKKDCDSLRIPWYDAASSGAFVMNL
jgi:competence protein ComEC